MVGVTQQRQRIREPEKRAERQPQDAIGARQVVLAERADGDVGRDSRRSFVRRHGLRTFPSPTRRHAPKIDRARLRVVKLDLSMGAFLGERGQMPWVSTAVGRRGQRVSRVRDALSGVR
jgi:hypothetical protein